MSLVKARLAVFQEAESTDVLQAGIIKSITGEDTISTRGNYGKQQKWRPKFKSLFVCNKVPGLSETTLAIYRRMRVVEFTTSFVDKPVLAHERKVNKQLDQQLRVAAPHFIGMLIHYYHLFKSEGLEAPAAILNATSHYLDSVDAVKSFVTNNMAADPSAVIDDWATLKDAAYRFNSNLKKMKVPDLKAEFKKHGVVVEDTYADGTKFRGVRGWRLE